MLHFRFCRLYKGMRVSPEQDFILPSIGARKQAKNLSTEAGYLSLSLLGSVSENLCIVHISL